MSFVLKNSSSSYSWPVSFSLPENGTRKEQSFDAEFKRLKQSRINEIQALVQQRLKALEDGLEDASGVSDVSIADEVLVGWDGIDDDDGNPVKFSQSSLQQLVDVPMVATAIATAYFDSLSGAKRKN